MLKLISLRGKARKSLLSTLPLTARSFHSSSHCDFLFRSEEDVKAANLVVNADTDNMNSLRYIVRGDNCGFSLQHDVLEKGKCVEWAFYNYVVAAYVIGGSGKLRLMDHSKNGGSHGHNSAVSQTNKEINIQKGSCFALEAFDRVQIEADEEDLHLISVMNPPVVGSEKQLATEEGYELIDNDGVKRESFDMNLLGELFNAPESIENAAGSLSNMKDDPLF